MDVNRFDLYMCMDFLSLSLPNISLRKLDLLAFGYFNSCSVVLSLVACMSRVRVPYDCDP